MKSLELVPLLSCLCLMALIAAAMASYATSAATRRERARQLQNPVIAKEEQSATEARVVSSNNDDRSHRGGVIAQYRLPLPAPANEAVEDIKASGRNKSRLPHEESQSKPIRRRTQIVMRRKVVNSSTTTTRPTTTTSSTTTTTPRPSLANGFNFFSPNFWSFGQQSIVAVSTPRSTTTKRPHPPKKFTHATASSSKDEKLSYRKQIMATAKPLRNASRVTTTSTTTTTLRPATDGPFRIALPTLTLSSAAAPAKGNEREKDKRATIELRQRFNCPRENEVRFQLFPKICKTDKDCAVWQRDEICCDIFGANSCVAGKPKPLEETAHAPILGLIPRKCPTRPLAELWWDVQECNSDMDCWPRLCCPDGRRRYCRTSQPELETAPVPVKRSFDYFTEYLECTAPPPPIFDLHPKACTSTLDCFPNVCCQEAGLRHCRPPKKSVLTLMANFLNVDFVKRLAQNIVIK